MSTDSRTDRRRKRAYAEGWRAWEAGRPRWPNEYLHHVGDQFEKLSNAWDLGWYARDQLSKGVRMSGDGDGYWPRLDAIDPAHGSATSGA